MKDLSQPYSVYLEKKYQDLKNQLAQLGLSHLLQTIHPTPLENGFRNRAKFKIFWQDRDHFKMRGTDPILGDVPYEKALWILPEKGRELISSLAGLLQGQPHVYGVDGIEIQLGHGKLDAHVTLSVKRTLELNVEPFIKSMYEKVPILKGVSVPSQDVESGDPYLRHTVAFLEICSHHRAFFQSNLNLTDSLVLDLKKICHSIKPKQVLDLYCGCGLFSLSLGHKHIPIWGIDSNSWAVKSAIKNAKSLGFKQFQYVSHSVEDHVFEMDIDSEALVLIDPPRSGCPEPVILGVARKQPRHICLISCFPDTLVRDLALWLKSGYTILDFRAYDMFPFSEFLETVAVLGR